MLQGGNEIWLEIGNTLGRKQLSSGKKKSKQIALNIKILYGNMK